MSAKARRFGPMALALSLILALTQTATAQMVRPAFVVNPNPQIAPGVSLLQYSYNTAVLGRAYRQIPPYLLGYNPYPPAVGVAPGYGGMPYAPAAPYAGAGYGGMPYGGAGGGYSPYGGSPYGGGYSAGGVDPLTGLPAGGGYSGYPGYSPYGYGYNSSSMDLLAYGQLGLDQEKARILRETANQAKLDTRKKVIDTLAYERANAYTFTKEQADIAKRLLERVQKTPTQAEVQSGKSLNVMLKDLVAFKNDNIKGLPTIVLEEDVLKLVNICGPGSTGNVGLLRDNGQFTWPSAFDDKNIVSEKDRRDLEVEAKQLYQQAANGPPDPNMLRNVESSLRALRTNLTKNITNIPNSSNYLDAQRFLDDFDAAVVGIKKGDVAFNIDFQQKFVKGGKTVQELVNYLGDKGLHFAGATPGDARAYAALQAAFSAQSIALQQRVASNSRDG